jgi:hypothetical protein
MNAPSQSESTALTVATQQTSTLMLSPALMTQMMAVAQSMSEATITVPVHFRGKPGDCLAVVMQATQWNMNPYTVAQKTHVVNGQLGYEAQLVHAVLQATGAIDGSFTYEYRGEGPALECRVGATCRGDRTITWSEWLPMSNVTTRNSPLWKTNPRQQMGYLQVKNWARAFKPGAILGVYTPDELEAQPPTEKHMGPADVVQPAAGAAATTEKVYYPDEQFKANLPKWHEVIAKGRKSADEIIAMAETKHPLSDAQKAEVRKGKAAPAQPTQQAQDVTPKVTYAAVADAIHKAEDQDQLAAAKALIEQIGDEGQRGELTRIADERGEELPAF